MLHELDTSGLLCPYPLLKAKNFLEHLQCGEKVRIISTDPASQIDFKVFAQVSNDVLLEEHYYDEKQKQYIYVLKKLLPR